MTTFADYKSSVVTPDAGAPSVDNLGNVDPAMAKKIAAMVAPFAVGAMVSGYWALMMAYMQLYNAQSYLQSAAAGLTSSIVDVKNKVVTEQQKIQATDIQKITTETDPNKINVDIAVFNADSQIGNAAVTKIDGAMQPPQNLTTELPQQFGTQTSMMGDLIQDSGKIATWLAG